MTDNDAPDDALALLLPFYANGSLAADARAEVEAGLARSAALRAELEAVQHLKNLVQDGGAAFAATDDTATAARLEKLLARIDAEVVPAPAQPATRRSAPPAQSGFWASLLRFHWQPALAASATALVLLQTGAITYLATRESGANYGTLSGPQTAASPSAPAAAILLQFKTGARWYDIQNLMAREDLHFAGALTDGVVGVAPSTPKSAAEIAALTARLRVSPIVAFAGAAE
jgi:anti-sigma factor RsiW